MIKIYYLTSCPHSQKAVETLRKLKIPTEEIVADDIKTAVVERNKTLNNNYSKFPQIFFGDSKYFVGGNSDLQTILDTLKSGKIPETRTSRKHELKLYLFLTNYI